MIIEIRKRDGRTVPFNIEKIANAIFKAAQAVGGQDYNTSLSLAVEVANNISKRDSKLVPDVESIQDEVEKVLIENGHAKTAKEYILYRAERNRARNMDSRLMKKFEEVTFKKDKKLLNYEKNSGMNLMTTYGSEAAREFYDLYVLNPDHSRAHKNGYIHINNLEFLTLASNSCQIDYKKYLETGFRIKKWKIGPAENIRDAINKIFIILQANQNDQFGNQNIANIDYLIGGFVKKSYVINYRKNLKRLIEVLIGDNTLKNNIENIYETLEEYNLTPEMEEDSEYMKKETEYLRELGIKDDIIEKVQTYSFKYSFKEVLHELRESIDILFQNLNTIESRIGSKPPISTIDYGTDTSNGGRLVTKIIIERTSEFFRENRFRYPYQNFKLKKGKNLLEEDKNYDLYLMALNETINNGSINFVNLDADYNYKYYKENRPETEVSYSSYGIRLLENNYNRDKNIIYGRGNLSITSLNLPRLALKSQGNIKKFYKELDYILNLIIEQLLERFEIQASMLVSDYPFLMGQGVWMDSDKLKNTDSLREVLKNGSLTISIVGLSESLKILGLANINENIRLENLGLKIIGYIYERVTDISNQYKMNFNLSGVNNPKILKRFYKIDSLEFKDLKDKWKIKSYSDGFKIPLNSKFNLDKRIKIEGKYHKFAQGGHRFDLNLETIPKKLNDIQEVINLMMKNEIGYVSIKR